MAKYFFNKKVYKAASVYFLLICIAYFPILFSSKTLSMAVRYPWFNEASAESIWNSGVHTNTFNVDIGSPAAIEETHDIFFGNQMRDGIFPMWNPFIGCGSVVQERFDTRTLFPFQILQNVFPKIYHDFFLLFRIWSAAIGVFIFLRILGLSSYACFCGGMLYGFSGNMTIFVNFTQMSNHTMTLPFVFIALELLIQKSNIRRLFFSVVMLSLLIFAGQPEVSFYGFFLLFCYAIFRVLKVKEKRGKKLFFVFFAIVLSLIVALPFFLPFLYNSNQYYHLHSASGTQGTQTPTPFVNFMAIVFPELLRWHTQMSSFTINLGWDALGGYMGISSFIFVVAGFLKKWKLRPYYLFFIFFSLFILLKNMNVPLFNLIGKLPVFNQVWTPRWSGPIWSFCVAVAASLSFEVMLNEFPKAKASFKLPQKKLLITLLGLFVSLIAVSFLDYRFFTKVFYQYDFQLIKTINIVSIIGVFLLLFRMYKRFMLPMRFLLFFVFLFFSCCAFFMQFSHIESGYSYINYFKDHIALLSMWQAVAETVVFSSIVFIVFSFLFKKENICKNKFSEIALSVVIVEMLFHVTLGYAIAVRVARLFLYSVTLLLVVIYTFIFEKEYKRTKKILISIFLLFSMGISVIGSDDLPQRRFSFDNVFKDFNYDKTYRFMGLKGALFPNLSEVYGFQDVRSIACISDKRYQLFQNNFLFSKPQSEYKSLWFTGIADPSTGKRMCSHIVDNFSFYSLAGVKYFVSNRYERIAGTRLIYDKDVKIYENTKVLPRAFIVYDWDVVDSIDKTLSWMRNNSDILGQKAVIESKNNLFFEKPKTSNKNYIAKILKYSVHSVFINTQTSSPGLLILTDVYHPHWKVFIDGVEKKVFPADLSFRAVYVPAGLHKIEFLFVPVSFYVSLAISLTVITILCIMALMERRNQEKE